MSRVGRNVRRALVLGAVVATACWVVAHVRLVNPSNGVPLRWLNPDSISIVLSSRPPEGLEDRSHLPALRTAIDAWNAAPGSEARLVENDAPSEQERTDWESDSVHLVYFDATGSSGYFSSGSGIVAVTPVYFFASGRIADADVLFDAKHFQFTTSQEPGRFDVADVGTHELGHLLGLDHTGWAGGTLYPYVDPAILLHRSPSLDDHRGLRDAYPDAAFASITGRLVRGEDGDAVRGAHVVARDSTGRPVAATLSDDDGAFRLAGLDAGSYALYAAPLEGPVNAGNLSSGQAVDVDFGTTRLGTVTVPASETADAGTLALAPDAAISAGRVGDDYPLRVVRGATRRVRVQGSGFGTPGTIVPSDPTLGTSDVEWSEWSVELDVDVPADAPLGHVDLEITTASGELGIVTAALEITPPDPLVSSVAPSSGDAAGGATLTIQGAHFRSGARVVVGDRVYEEGVVGGATLVDEGTLLVTLGATVGGLHDVVVIDPSGVEGRLAGGFLALAEPTIDAIFPAAGAAEGGTLVRLFGESFAAGAAIAIGGVPQEAVVVESTRELRFVTTAGRAGETCALTVTNPGGAVATCTFRYVASPDPVVTAVEPASGSVAGGEEVFVRGASFTPATRVVFGADDATGAGGISATTLEFVDATTLRVLTPSMGSGTKSVLVRDPATQQASLLSGAFTYQGSKDEGGACAGVVASGPPSARDVAGGAGWIVVALAAGVLARRRALRPLAPAHG